MVTVDGLFYAYPHQSKDTLKGLSFEIEGGEVFGFLGPNGSGKSTTQKLLIGLLKDYRGVAKVFDRSVASWGPEVYRRIGVGFELPNHYAKLTALENMQLFASLYGLQGKAARARIRQLLVETDLDGAANQYTDQFSKGMKVRLNFARALLPDPDLLFLDEPTTGLDPVNAANVRAMIQAQQTRGKTVFLTTHNMRDADELCDRVAFIVDGHIKHIDSPRTMKQEYGDSTVRLEQRGPDGELVSHTFPLPGLGDNAEFQEQLTAHPIETIHSNEATLEDVFIKVTGERLA